MKTLRKILLTLVLVLIGIFGLASCKDKTSSSATSSTTSSVESSAKQSSTSKEATAAEIAAEGASQVILSQDHSPSQVANFEVPSMIKIDGKDVMLTWESDSVAAVVGAKNADNAYPVEVSQQATATTVTLTLTATYEGKTATKTFRFGVPESNLVTSKAAFKEIANGEMVTIVGKIADITTGYDESFGSFKYIFMQLSDDDASTLTQVYVLKCTPEQAKTDILVGATISLTGERAEYKGAIQLKFPSTYKLIKGLDAGQVAVNKIVADLGNPFANVSTTDVSETAVTTTVGTDAITYSSDSSYVTYADGKVTITPPTKGIANVDIKMVCVKDGFTGTSIQKLTIGTLNEASYEDFMALDDYTTVMISGTIVSVDSAWDADHKSQTVTIQVGDNEANTLEMKYLKVASAEVSASEMKVGTVITVTGQKRAYTNDGVTTVQLKSGTYVLSGEEITAVNAAAEALVNPFAEVYTDAASDLALTAAPADMTITYVSDNAAVVINEMMANVVLPAEGQVTVKVTATITKGETSATKEFTVKVGTAVVSEDAPDLFISSYYEGSTGNNKYVILTNNTNAVLDLTGYVLGLYTNGGTEIGNTIDLGATFTEGLAANGTIAIINSATDDATAVAAIDACTLKADSNVCYYNGDDALTLTKNDVVVDYFGLVGNPKDNKLWADQLFIRTAAPTAPVTAFDVTEWTATAV